MIGTDEIRSLLTRHQIVPCTAEELTDDTPFSLDSMALVWFQHVLEEEHGISVDPYDADVEHFTSVRGIHTYLCSLAGAAGAAGAATPEGRA